MAVFTINNIKVRGISAAVPKNTVSNYQLPNYDQNELDKLINTIGIENRRVVDDTTCASDLCIVAAEKLITDFGWNKSEIEVLFFVTQTPDYQLPGTSLHIQERLGLPKTCVAFDINQGCAGYVYGLSLISAFMSASKLKKGLLLVGDTITKLISADDKSLTPIFSDCGTATALCYYQHAEPIHFNLSSEGKDYEAIIVKDGGARNQNTNEKKLSMKGLDVFNFSIKKVVPNVEDLLFEKKYSTTDVDYFLFHQANKLILESIAEKLNVPLEKVPSSLKDYGNTSGATIPLTYVTNLKHLTKKSTLLLSGFGVGLSLASAIVSIDNLTCSDLIEV